MHYIRIFLLLTIGKLSNLLFYVDAFLWRVKVGKGASIFGRVYLRRAPRSVFIIGDNCRILSRFDSNLHGLNHSSMISCLQPGSEIRIGEDCGFSGVIICSSLSVTIGNRVMIGANTRIVDTDSHSLDFRERHPRYFNLLNNDFKEYVKCKPIVIEDDVFIGMNSIILKGVRIGSGSVIGAGSVVICDVPNNSIYAGNPAKFIRNTGCV